MKDIHSKRTTLTKNSTFISISKQVQFTFDNLTLSSINKKLESSETVTRSEAPEVNWGAWIPAWSAGKFFKTVIGWLHWKSLVQAHCFRKSNSSTFKDFKTKIQGLSRTSNPRTTQPYIHPGFVNEYQLRLGRQRQVWFIPLADECGVCR